MSEILTRDELIVAVNRLMISAMEDIDVGRNEAGDATLALVLQIEDHDRSLRAENERLREAIKEWAPALREACIRVLPEEAEPWTWLALLGEARDAADALDRALAAPPEEKEVPRG